MEIKNQTTTNQAFIINEPIVIYESTLIQCSLNFKIASRYLTTMDVGFIESEISVIKPFTNFRWTYVYFKGCTFRGKFSGNEFGNWPDLHGRPKSSKIGVIEDCDFSNAILDGCRFTSCDVSKIKFPKWPCFTILNPKQNFEILKNLSWPGKIGNLFALFQDFREDAVAASFYVPDTIKRYGGDENTLFQEFKKLSFILI